MTSIPLFATRGALEPLLPQIAQRQREVLESGRYILGPEVEAFEHEFARYLGARHCVGVANGTEALTIALRALGLKAGDEVVLPAYSFFATAEAVINAGCRPALCDVDPATHCMTAATAAPALTDRTRALLPVHIFGNPAPMDELLRLASERELLVVEDAAQAAGAELGERRAGSLGHAAGFSFYPGKNLGAFGDAGAIVTDDEAVASRARLLRDHGSERKWVHSSSGYNSRLDEIQATALRVLLGHLDGWTARRREIARAYRDAGLAELLTLSAETPGAAAAHHLFVALAPDRDKLIARLAAAGVEARAYYTPALHQQQALREFSDGASRPNAERVAAQNLALPMGPALATDAVETVVSAVRTAIPTAREDRARLDRHR